LVDYFLPGQLQQLMAQVISGRTNFLVPGSAVPGSSPF